MIFKVVKKQAWPDDELCLKFRWDSSSLFISKSMARQILSKSKHLFMVEKPRSSNTCSTTTKSTRTLTTLIVSHDVQACGRLEHQEDNLAVKSLIRVQELLSSCRHFLPDKGILIEDWRNSSRDAKCFPLILASWVSSSIFVKMKCRNRKKNCVHTAWLMSFGLYTMHMCRKFGLPQGWLRSFGDLQMLFLHHCTQ